MFGGYMHGYGGWLWMILNMLFYGIILLGVILFVIWVVKRFGSSSPSGGSQTDTQTPEAILKSRYARGEITRDEYREILEDLKKS